MKRLLLCMFCIWLFALAPLISAQTNLGPIETTTHDQVGANSAPANPATNLCREYFDLNTGQELWVNSSGGSCGPASGAGGFNYVYPSWGGPPTATGQNVVGPMATGATQLGSGGSVNPTATDGPGQQLFCAASATTNTCGGYTTGHNGNNSVMGMLAFYSWQFKWKIDHTTNARYWTGLGCWTIAGNPAGGGVGNNQLTNLGTVAYAADTLNKTTLGFRFSSGTDTHWQAVAAVASGGGGSQTTVDTGVSPDTTAPHVFQMKTNATGTSVLYLIDGKLVATISTNLPSMADANSWGDMFWTVDNKNTATSPGAIMYWMQIALK